MKTTPFRSLLIVLTVCGTRLICPSATRAQDRPTPRLIVVDPGAETRTWDGWGSSLAWWGRAIGGTRNADFYADLIYTTKTVEGYPGLGLNIVRYNVGGGGVQQPEENKGPKLQWQMDIHGYWQNPKERDPAKWDWWLDANQRAMMRKARDRGANVFEMFSDSPMWWMNSNRSTSGSETGGDCLAAGNIGRFAIYLANVARYAADHWDIKFGSVEPFNEPSAMWWKYPGRQEGCHFDVNTQKTMAQALRKELDRLGLENVVVAAADENDIDQGLQTWQGYDEATRAFIGKVNVHGYYRGTDPYRGSNRTELRCASGDQRLWQSEYGEPDGSGLTLGRSIILDLKELKPSAWVYWQPVEPQSGWGMLNAEYVDTDDQLDLSRETRLLTVNRKFYVYGQFTRFIRPGYRILAVDDSDSVAAYDPAQHRLVIVTVTGDKEKSVSYELSKFKFGNGTVQRVATTTAPREGVPDWKQRTDLLPLDHSVLTTTLYPNSVYTFVYDNVAP
jgi:galactan endo-1,6-beta-galactosidase